MNVEINALPVRAIYTTKQIFKVFFTVLLKINFKDI